MIATRPTAGVVPALVLAAAALTIGVACPASDTACTPESSGFGGQSRVRHRPLSEAVSRETCRPRVEVIRSDAELRRAYEDLGLPIINVDGGASAPNAMRLPIVDWDRQTVVLREATDDQPITWIVLNGETLTVGTQACASSGTGACAADTLVVAAVATKVNLHACDPIGCDGVLQEAPP